MAGRATLTTVPSRKTIPLARIIATSVPRFVVSPTGAVGAAVSSAFVAGVGGVIIHSTTFQIAMTPSLNASNHAVSFASGTMDCSLSISVFLLLWFDPQRGECVTQAPSLPHPPSARASSCRVGRAG